MRDCLPFGHDILRLGWRLDRGHSPNPTMSCGHQIYYHHVNSGNSKNIKGKAHPRPQYLDRSFCRADNSCGPNQEDRSTHGGVPDTSGTLGCAPSTGPEPKGSVTWPTRNRKEKCTLTQSFHPCCITPVPTHSPLSRVCSMLSTWHTLGMIC